jgi:hypothetical protein
MSYRALSTVHLDACGFISQTLRRTPSTCTFPRAMNKVELQAVKHAAWDECPHDHHHDAPPPSYPASNQPCSEMLKWDTRHLGEQPLQREDHGAINQWNTFPGCSIDVPYCECATLHRNRCRIRHMSHAARKAQMLSDGY